MRKSVLRSYFSMFLGPCLMLITVFIDPPFSDMSVKAWHTAGLTLFMAAYWVTEVIPIPITSLFPIILVPLLGIASLKEATAGFSNPVIYIFLGGFILSLAMERTNLHKRIAINCLSLVGTRPTLQLSGFMMVTAFLSMWISNTATSAMMLPVGLSIISVVNNYKEGKFKDDFAKALLLGIAYSASIGGIATLVGTPPNIFLAAFLKDQGIAMSFVDWMKIGLPFTVLMLILSFFVLVKINKVSHKPLPELREFLNLKKRKLGKLKRTEKVVLFTFLITAAAWITRKQLVHLFQLPLSDTSIALISSVFLFACPLGGSNPSSRILRGKDLKKIPWGVLILFGGGLSLAEQIKSSGLAGFIASRLTGLSKFPLLFVIISLLLLIIFMTELTSNTATTAAFLPILFPISQAMGVNPLFLLIPTTIAASCAFMLPVATPPNAIVFGSGKLGIKDMIKPGIFLNLIGVVLITLLSYFCIKFLI